MAIRSGRNITGVSVGDPDNATVIILNEDCKFYSMVELHFRDHNVLDFPVTQKSS